MQAVVTQSFFKGGQRGGLIWKHITCQPNVTSNQQFLQQWNQYSCFTIRPLQQLSTSDEFDTTKINENEESFEQKKSANQDAQVVPSERQACVSFEQIQQWAERFKCDLSSRVGIKWLVYDREVGVIMGPNGVDAQQMVNKHNARTFISHQGDYYPGVRRRLAALVGNGEGVFVGLSELLPALQKHQYASTLQVSKDDKGGGPKFKLQEGEMSLITIFPEEVLKKMRGMKVLSKNEVDKECDIQFYTEKPQDRMPAVQTYKVSLIGAPANVLKALILLVGYCQQNMNESYRKFINQTVQRHTETAWFGLLNRSLPQDSSLKKGEYKVEFTAEPGTLSRISQETMESIIKKSKASIQIEEHKDGGDRKNVTITGQYHVIMRAQALMITEILKKNKQLNPVQAHQKPQEQQIQ